MAQWNHGRKGHDMEQTSEARLHEAHERMMDTLNGLRNGILHQTRSRRDTGSY